MESEATYQQKYTETIAELKECKQYTVGLEKMLYTLSGDMSLIRAIQADDHIMIVSHDKLIKTWQGYQSSGKGLLIFFLKVMGLLTMMGGTTAAIGYIIHLIKSHV